MKTGPQGTTLHFTLQHITTLRVQGSLLISGAKRLWAAGRREFLEPVSTSVPVRCLLVTCILYFVVLLKACMPVQLLIWGLGPAWDCVRRHRESGIQWR